MGAQVLAERYRELGFRVIEGGKSGRLVVLKSPGLAWAIGKRADHVKKDIEDTREKISPNLGRSFDVHCRPALYRDRYGREQECFELTQTGLLIIGAKYDATLLLLLGLLFDAVTTVDDAAADSVLAQIKGRLKDIRGKAAQAELDLECVVEPVAFTPEVLAAAPRALSNESRSELRLWGDIDDDGDGVLENGLAQFWPHLEGLEAGRAHHYRDHTGPAWTIRSYKKRVDGTIGRVEIYKYAGRSAACNLKETPPFYLTDGYTSFVLLYDKTVPPSIAIQLLNKECALSSEVLEATITHFLDV
jgi:hypothetical protein